jgi:hypothetical protein
MRRRLEVHEPRHPAERNRALSMAQQKWHSNVQPSLMVGWAKKCQVRAYPDARRRPTRHDELYSAVPVMTQIIELRPRVCDEGMLGPAVGHIELFELDLNVSWY